MGFVKSKMFVKDKFGMGGDLSRDSRFTLTCNFANHGWFQINEILVKSFCTVTCCIAASPEVISTIRSNQKSTTTYSTTNFPEIEKMWEDISHLTGPKVPETYSTPKRKKSFAAVSSSSKHLQRYQEFDNGLASLESSPSIGLLYRLTGLSCPDKSIFYPGLLNPRKSGDVAAWNAARTHVLAAFNAQNPRIQQARFYHERN